METGLGPQIAPNPRSKSSIMSMTSSRPTDNRTIPGEIPTFARSSTVNLEWVVVDGWVIRLLASPRLLEMSMSSRAFRKRKVSSFVLAASKATRVEPLFICRLANANWGWVSKLGWSTRETPRIDQVFGDDFRVVAMAEHAEFQGFQGF